MTTKSLSAPLPPDFVDRLSAVVRAAMDHDGWRFSCEKAEFTSEEVSAPDGLLPVWIHQAQEWMLKTVSSVPAHMVYQRQGNALCAAVPAPEGPSASLAMWALHIHFAMDEWRSHYPELALKNEPVPMDELYTKWQRLVYSESLPMRAPKPIPGILPEMGGPAPSGPLVMTAPNTGE